MSKDGTTESGRPPVLAIGPDGTFTLGGERMSFEEAMARIEERWKVPDQPIMFNVVRPNTRAENVSVTGANDA